MPTFPATGGDLKPPLVEISELRHCSLQCGVFCHSVPSQTSLAQLRVHWWTLLKCQPLFLYVFRFLVVSSLVVFNRQCKLIFKTTEVEIRILGVWEKRLTWHGVAASDNLAGKNHTIPPTPDFRKFPSHNHKPQVKQRFSNNFCRTLCQHKWISTCSSNWVTTQMILE